MKTTFRLYTFSVLALSAAAVNCGGEDANDPALAPNLGTPQDSSPSRIRILPLQKPGDPQPGEVQREEEGSAQFLPTAAKTLTYYGGPVVQNINVIPVYWNASVSNRSGITAFYSAIVTGAVMNFLSQYSTTSPSQTIGNGTLGAPYVATQTSTSVSDPQVQFVLTAAFNSGALPKPSNNNYYPVHFPSGVSISTFEYGKSCVQFCAYHSVFVYNGQKVYYAVLPDMSQSGCDIGCGSSTVYNNTTTVASHEFADVITDPANDLATIYGAPLGWFSPGNGQLADMCNGLQATETLGDGKSYTVRKLWSNKTASCVKP